MKACRKARKNKFVDTYFYSRKKGKCDDVLMWSLTVTSLLTFYMSYINDDFENNLTTIIRLILTSGIIYEMILDADDKVRYKKSKIKLKQIEEMLKEKGYDISFDADAFIITKENPEDVAICYDDFLFDCTKDKIMFTDENGKVFDVTDDINKVLKKKRKKLD